MACGRPVVALAKGGALETVVDGQTGIFFKEQTVESLVEALRRFDGLSFNAPAIRRHAEKFSRQEFERQFQDFVAQSLADFHKD